MLVEYILILEKLMKKLMELANKIEEKEAYSEMLKESVKEIEYTINLLFQIFSDVEIAEAAGFDNIYILQILQDLMNAIENDDRVLLIDVLRFALYVELQKVYEFMIAINEEMEEA